MQCSSLPAARKIVQTLAQNKTTGENSSIKKEIGQGLQGLGVLSILIGIIKARSATIPSGVLTFVPKKVVFSPKVAFIGTGIGAVLLTVGTILTEDSNSSQMEDLEQLKKAPLGVLLKDDSEACGLMVEHSVFRVAVETFVKEHSELVGATT